MKIVFWILLGTTAGLFIFLSQRKTVQKLSVKTEKPVRRAAIIGSLGRWLLAGTVMAAGFLNSVEAGMAVFGSLWIVKWIGIFSQKLRLQDAKTSENKAGRS